MRILYIPPYIYRSQHPSLAIMFRRSKDKLSPPEPPTFAQILEDLNTFEIERPINTEVRSLEIPTSSASHSNDTTAATRDATFTKWWSAFETFRSDVQDLHRLRRKILSAKEELVKANDEVVYKVDEAKRHIKEAIESVPVPIE